MPLTNVVSQTGEIDQTIAQEIALARLCTAFAALALVIACVGLYATVTYAVTRRTKEIGIRLALGARRAAVIWMVLREVCVLAALGLAISLPSHAPPQNSSSRFSSTSHRATRRRWPSP